MELDEDLGRILLRAFPEGRVERAMALSGGISARAVVVDLALPGPLRRRIVVRRPGRETMEEMRQVVRAEHAALTRCTLHGIPAPKPAFLDVEAAAIGVEHLEGAPNFAPSSVSDMLEQMAAELSRIHALEVTEDLLVLERSAANLDKRLGWKPPPDLALGEPRIRAVLGELWPWEQDNTDVFLHGDYWPGNLLWQEGRLTAVLDWEESQIGDPLADLAGTRLELAFAFGDGAMHEFTDRYAARRAIDLGNLARWDLAAALRPMSNLHRWASSYPPPPINRPDITESTMRECHRRFVQEALESIQREVR